MQVSSSLWTRTNVDNSARAKQVLVLQLPEGLQARDLASALSMGPTITYILSVLCWNKWLFLEEKNKLDNDTVPKYKSPVSVMPRS